MQPQNQIPNNNPNQYQGPPQGPGQDPTGAWDFLNTPSEPPKKESFFSRNKRFVIIVGGAMGFLLILAVVAAFAGGGNPSTATNSDYIEGPSTTVPLQNYDKEVFSMQYPTSLSAVADEAIDSEGESGWYVLLAKSPEELSEGITITVSNEAPPYELGDEAVNALLDTGVTATNLSTSEVALAGVKTQKTLAEFIGTDANEYYVTYASAKQGESFVTVSAMYLKDNQDIINSFDAIIGSIKLKTMSEESSPL